MFLKRSRCAQLFAAAGVCAVAVWSQPAFADDAGTIYQAIQDLDDNRPMRDADRADDIEYTAVYNAENRAYSTKRVMLIGDLLEADASHSALIDLLPYRWANATLISRLDVSDEIESFAALQQENYERAQEAVRNGRYQVAYRAARMASRDYDKANDQIDEYIGLYPDHTSCARLLYSLARATKDEAARAKIENRILEDYPESSETNSINGMRRRYAAVGEPFELTFNDWMTGSQLSMEDLRGKVVVVDFWATWCGPCKAELPHLKEMYARYKGDGMEIVGISLDRDPAVIKPFCDENDMTWPQYCEDGRTWDTEFSKGWGINSIPAVFVIDRDGILRSADARGKLEEIVPDLLNES